MHSQFNHAGEADQRLSAAAGEHHDARTGKVALLKMTHRGHLVVAQSEVLSRKTLFTQGHRNHSSRGKAGPVLDRPTEFGKSPLQRPPPRSLHGKHPRLCKRAQKILERCVTGELLH